MVLCPESQIHVGGYTVDIEIDMNAYMCMSNENLAPLAALSPASVRAPACMRSNAPAEP